VSPIQPQGITVLWQCSTKLYCLVTEAHVSEQLTLHTRSSITAEIARVVPRKPCTMQQTRRLGATFCYSASQNYFKNF